MNNPERGLTIQEHPDIQPASPPSKLRKDIEERKANKELKRLNRKSGMPQSRQPKAPKWGEIAPFVEACYSLLQQYGTIGLSAEHAIDGISPDKRAEFEANIATLYGDIVHFSNKAARLRGLLKDPKLSVTIDDLTDFYDIYMETDQLRLDIMTALTPTAEIISEEINRAITPPKAETTA